MMYNSHLQYNQKNMQLGEHNEVDQDSFSEDENETMWFAFDLTVMGPAGVSSFYRFFENMKIGDLRRYKETAESLLKEAMEPSKFTYSYRYEQLTVGQMSSKLTKMIEELTRIITGTELIQL